MAISKDEAAKLTVSDQEAIRALEQFIDEALRKEYLPGNEVRIGFGRLEESLISMHQAALASPKVLAALVALYQVSMWKVSIEEDAKLEGGRYLLFR